MGRRLEGENSYRATMGYNPSTAQFLKRPHDHVDERARQAAEILEGEQAEGLTQAERDGVRKAPH